MATFQGSMTFTVSGGVAGAVSQVGAVLLNGVYSIAVNSDNTGVSLTCITPYGATGTSGFDPGDDIQ